MNIRNMRHEQKGGCIMRELFSGKDIGGLI